MSLFQRDKNRGHITQMTKHLCYTFPSKFLRYPTKHLRCAFVKKVSLTYWPYHNSV